MRLDYQIILKAPPPNLTGWIRPVCDTFKMRIALNPSVQKASYVHNWFWKGRRLASTTYNAHWSDDGVVGLHRRVTCDQLPRTLLFCAFTFGDILQTIYFAVFISSETCHKVRIAFDLFWFETFRAINYRHQFKKDIPSILPSLVSKPLSRTCSVESLCLSENPRPASDVERNSLWIELPIRVIAFPNCRVRSLTMSWRYSCGTG